MGYAAESGVVRGVVILASIACLVIAAPTGFETRGGSTMTEPIDTHCARCLRPAPGEDDTDLYWECLDEVIVCPDCITPAEQQAMDEDGMAMLDEISGLDDE